MDPEYMIVRLNDMVGDVRRYASHLADEAELIGEEWAGLGRVGGRRADHAAQLMCKLRPILRDLAGFCTAAEKHITDMQADPFQRGK